MSATQKLAPWVEPIAAKYRDSHAQVVRTAGRLSADDLAKPSGDAGWTVRDELIHIAASLSDFATTLGAAVRGLHVDMSRFADIDASNASNLASRAGYSTDDVVRDVERDGRTVQELLAQLTPADESRQPDGVPFPLGRLLQGYAMHDPYHLGQIHAVLVSAMKETP